MNQKWHNGQRPTPQDCRVVMGLDRQGRPITWAMMLGKEKHREAQACVDEILRDWMKGRYSVEQRYRYLGFPGQVEPLSAQQVRKLQVEGQWEQLVGTLEPDIVIHTGNPKKVLWVYDFKFPCVDLEKVPRWSGYPEGHPFAHLNQGMAYEQAFNVSAARVVPGKGVVR